MKTQKFLFPALFLILFIGLSSLISFNSPNKNLENIDMPENVKMVIDSKCFGCHNVESTSDKAKEKLLWDQLDQLPKSKLVLILGDIEEVLKEDKMPPAKFLEKKPEMKLTDEEKELLKDWAVASADKMIN